MVIHQYKTIFFHVPKVAGYAIEQHLLPGPKDYKVFNKDIVFGINRGIMTQHTTYSGMQQYVDENTLNSYYKFAFFRNTWDRLCSAFCYLQPHYLKQYGSFENCITEVCDLAEKGNYQEGWHFCKQTDYLYKSKENKEVALNFVGKYENLDEDFKKLCEQIGAPEKPLKKLNTSKLKIRHYREYYTPEIKELVHQTYKEEIEYFGYTF